MLAGISTACFYPEYTELSLNKLAELSVGSAEIFFNCDGEMDEGYVRELRRVADDAGIKILSVHPYTSGFEPMIFFSGYKRRFLEGMELYKRLYRAANLLGADIAVFHGGNRHLAIDYEEYFERLERLVIDANTYGVDLCHENVSRCVGAHPDFFERLAEAIPRARFVFDVKQAVRAGEDVCAFAARLGHRIRHVHISDHDVGNDCLPPGKGTFNIPKFLCTIKQNGFDGGVVVELYRENFSGIVEMSQGYKQLCNHISTLS